MSSASGAETPAPYDDSYLDGVKPPAGFFDRFRVGGFPTLYPSNLTPVTADVLEAGWIFAAVILGFSLLLVVPGVRRWSRRIYTVVRIVVAVCFWAFIMLCNFGQYWEVGHKSHVRTPYKAGVKEEIKASISVNIGLRSVNISLKGEPSVIQTFNNGLQNETVDYNERFSWNNDGWLLGRRFFGPYAGRYNQEFRAAQRRGLPYPILWIAEYLTLDGEGLRWGRHYLQAGYFTHIMLCVVPRYGGYFAMMTGASLLIGNIIFGSLRNSNELRLPVVYEGCEKKAAGSVLDSADCVMTLHYAWCFWLCMVTGILCFLIGVVTVLMDLFYPERLQEFLNVDGTLDLEEFVDDAEDKAVDEMVSERRQIARHRATTVRATARPQLSAQRTPDRSVATSGGSSRSDDIEMQARNGLEDSRHEVVSNTQAFRKRTVLTRVQKSRKIQQRPDSLFPPEYEQRPVQQQAGPGPGPGPGGPYVNVRPGDQSTSSAAIIDGQTPLYVNEVLAKRDSNI